jgi:thiol-disulfide isomerase/thioredoxin
MTVVPVHAPPTASAQLIPASLSPLAPTNPPKPAPSVVFTGADGRLHSLAEFRGRPVLLNLWATWCAPCVKELPALAALQKAARGRLVVIPVDVGRDGLDDAGTFLKSHGAGGLGVYVDSNAALLRTFGAYGLPMSVVIDVQGREIARAEGPAEWSAPDSIRYFDRLAKR